jgi:sulfoacetaldehyde acetyltransferase
MALFKDMVAYQEEVRDASRVAEVLNRVILQAKRCSAPAQINMPRDFWTQVIDIDLPPIVEFERPSGGDAAIAEAAELLSEAEFPVILNGAGVVLAGAIPASMQLAERLDAPVCCGYQHNDAFPGSHPLVCRAARLQRLKGGHGADRQGRCGAGPGHAAEPVLDPAGLRHRLLAEGRQDHPGRHQPRPDRADQAGDVGIVGDAKKVAEGVLPSGRRRRRQGAATRARPPSRRPRAPGPSSSPRWITRRTTPAPPGTSAPARPSRTG